MKPVVHKSASRGHTSLGWLNSKHTFSFGQYYDPGRTNFGTLRVLNDDIVERGMGFGTHPHDNMEIISIPLSGALAHKDSTGNTEVINTGDVQIMSAGSGLTHSEFNHSSSAKVNFLQIWILPKERNIKPRYEQKTFKVQNRINRLQNVVAPDNPEAIWINQDAWFYLSQLEAKQSLDYQLKSKSNGVYIFLIDGELVVEGHHMTDRDGIGLTDTDMLKIQANKDANFLLMDIPMSLEV